MDRIKKLYQYILGLKTENNIRYLTIIWWVVFVIILIISVGSRSESTDFYGIAETKEIVVSTEWPVEIKKIYVVPGQSINKNDLIVEFDRPELMRDINTVSHQLEELKSKYALNMELTNQFQSTGPSHRGTNNVSGGSHPLSIRIESLQKELALLLKEKNKLYVQAVVNGVIGSVNFKNGEKVPPFSPVVTLHTKTPSYIKGFIHEHAYNRIAIGDTVKVIPMANSGNRMTGVVKGVGSRIVLFPERLRKDPNVQVWGREVLVQLPKENGLILGEKVMLSLVKNDADQSHGIIRKAFSLLKRDGEKNIVYDRFNVSSDMKPIRIDPAVGDIKHIEASAVLYLTDIQRYLLVSDRTKHKKPVLYLMDDNGIVTEEVPIQGAGKISDMEAIAKDDQDRIYIVCSQRLKKKKLPNKRKKLLRVRRDKTLLMMDRRVYLYDLLKEAAGKNEDALWVKALAQKNSGMISVDIEGMYFYDGSLYVGLKSPLQNNQAMILKIDKINNVFEENCISRGSISIWKTFKLYEKDIDRYGGISDILFIDNHLFILSSIENGMNKSGSLWFYDVTTDRLNHVKRFKHNKPEGVTFNSYKNELFITFDNGKSKPSTFIRLLSQK